MHWPGLVVIFAKQREHQDRSAKTTRVCKEELFSKYGTDLLK